MLFANFLCLFFLMVLVSCHTISKSIANEDEIDDICDSLNNVDFKRERKGKHDRFIHQYKRENSNEVTKPFKNVKSTVTTKKTKPHEKSTEDIATKPIHTSIHSKLGKMWRKFRIKGKKDDKDKELSRKIRGKGGGRRRLNRHNTVPFHKHVTTVDERKYFDSNEVFTKRDRKTISKKRRKNYNQVVLAKRKQSVKDDESSINLTDLSANQTKPFSRNKEEICITPHKEYYKSTTVHNFKTATIKTYETPGFDDGLTNSLASTTTNKNNLNFLYRLNKYQKKSAIQNIKPNVFSEPTTESVEYLSTAQIEALLNDIKVKAVQMIAHQSPAITETIANAVTKIAFETNPILKHLKINSPGHALSNFVSLDPINKCCDKRNVNYMDMMINIPSNEPSMISSTETHNIEARSISRDAYTIAQSIEDKLQQELKNAFEKVKSQICHKDITKVAPKKTATMMAPTVVPSIETTKPFNANKKNTNAETLLRTNRGKTSKKHENIGNTENNKKAEALTRSSSTIDDYAMLTVCEHMLTKSRENSVLKLLMAPDAIMRKKKEALRLSKRNLETLTDLSLKENIQKIYNDEEEMPEESIDYGSDSNAKTIEMSATPNETKNNEEKEQGQATVKEDSLEGLITKLAYNDYVNGYKYYLNFQREQGDQKFSNLIKYQAHMHHNVDDIGKFILSKIPQIPTKRYKRNFFDNTDTLDDESWFKKNFYLFIENGTPKKYHTSQTVSLKSPITETRNKVASYNTENVIDKPVLENKCVDTESTDVNWSEPPKDYIHVPSYRSSTMNYVQLIKVDKEKLKTVKNENKDEKKNEIKILLDEELERHKRNAKKNEYSKIQSKRSTTTDGADFSKKSDIKSRKYGYVDVNLIRTTTAKIKNKKHKNNKLKNFFDKFRLRTNKKVNPKKAKRSSQIRVQRFFGFKNMFKTKPTDKPIPPTTTPREPSLDYDVTMTKNHYFKPFKFNNPLGVKDIQNMIPNITYDIPYGANINNLMPPVKYNIPETSIKPGDSHVFQAPKVTQAIQLKLPDSKIQNSLQDLKFRSRISVTDTPLNIVAPNDTFKQQIYSTSTPRELYTFNFEEASVNYLASDAIHRDINEIQMKLSVRHKPTANTISSIFENINKPLYFNTQKKESELHNPATFDFNKASVNDLGSDAIHRNINEIQMELSEWHKPKANTPISSIVEETNTSPYFNTQKKELQLHNPNIFDFNEASVKDLASNGIYRDINEIKMKLSLMHKPTANTLISSLFEKTNTSPYFNTQKQESQLHNLDTLDLEEASVNDFASDDIHRDINEIKMKLSMRYKPTANILISSLFEKPNQLTYFNSLKKESQLSKPSNPVSVKIGAKKFMVTNNGRREKSLTPKKIKNNNDINIYEATLPNVKYNTKPVSDYFNDLLMWHGDVLNADGVQKSTWDEILKSTNTETDATTPGLTNLQRDILYFQSINNTKASTVHPVEFLMTRRPEKTFNPDIFREDFGVNTPLNKKLKRFSFADVKHNLRESEDTNDGFENTPFVIVDSTILPFKNDIKDAIDGSRIKKMPKSSLKNSKSGMHIVIAKTNKQPSQYYTTPLPMSGNDFNKFLKENSLDVEYVTSPLMELPNFIDISPITQSIALKITNKYKMDSSISDLTRTTKSYNVSKTTKPGNQNLDTNINPTIDFGMRLKPTNSIDVSEAELDPENQIEYLNHLGDVLDDDYNFETDYERKRRKRYKPFDDYNYITTNSFQRESNKRKCDFVQGTMNFFTKSTTPKSIIDKVNLNDLVEPTGDKVHPNMEITIIDLDDQKDKQNVMYRDFDYHTVFSDEDTTRKADIKTTFNINEDTKLAVTIPDDNNLQQKSHSTISYQQILNELNRASPITNPEINSKNEYKLDKNVSQSDTPNAVTEYETTTQEIMNTLPVMQPHRVHISSHIYKYDFVYNDRNLDSSKEERDTLRIPFLPRIKKSAQNVNSATNQQQGNSINSEIQRFKVVNIVEAVDKIEYPKEQIYIDLPTYYIPNTDNIKYSVTTDKDVIAFVGYLTAKIKDYVMNGFDKNFNANKVFSDTQSEYEVKDNNEKNKGVRKRRSRGANTPKVTKNVKEITMFNGSENSTQNKIKVSQEVTTKGFHLIPLIKKKLNLLAKMYNTTKQGKTETTKWIKAMAIKTTTMTVQSADPLTTSANDKTKVKDKKIAVDKSTKDKVTKKHNNLENSTELIVTANDQHYISSTPSILKALGINKVPHSDKNQRIDGSSEDLKQKLTTSNDGKTLKEADSSNNLDTGMRYESDPKTDENEAIDVEAGSTNDKFRMSTSNDDKLLNQDDFTNNLDTGMSYMKPDENEPFYEEDGSSDEKFLQSTTFDENHNLNKAATTNDIINDIKYQLASKPDENDSIYVEEVTFDYQAPSQNPFTVTPNKETTSKAESNMTDYNGNVYVKSEAYNDSASTQQLMSENPKKETTFKSETKVSKPDEKEAVNKESRAYNKSISNKHSAKNKGKNKHKGKIKPHKNKPITDIKLEKRDITLPAMSHYTAKDVAALEVIVDLAKNTQSFHEKSEHDLDNRYYQSLSQRDKVHSATNSIQVHIAIPSDYQNNKRSVDPVRIRKVFSAKLSSPVDLEYQVNSFQHYTETTTQTEGLSPGMYLIVSNDTSVLKNALKPIGGTKYLDQIIAKRAINATEKDKVETSSAANLAKVTLSRDFISAVNKHLVQLYDNFYKLDASTHKVKVKRAAKTNHTFSVNAIKKFFGHDRVCDCKCRPNKTMCRVCAASDAVISELIFEFDNLGQYMKDHCTEIQTFFWMNPSGGKELKDAVHNIDNSLKDYYKNVKNKCKGCTCEAFATHIDKRNHLKGINKDNTYIGLQMAKDLNNVADILRNATGFHICYDKSLKNEADKLIDAFNSCISDKQLNKRANNDDKKKHKEIKNVYSLDNVNVNIICNAESSTKFVTDDFYKPGKKSHLFNYSIDGYTDEKIGGFRKLFGRKKQKYHSFVTEGGNKITTEKLISKREAKLNQIESPLIADTGGSFWNDYIKSTIEPKIVRETKILNQEPTFNTMEETLFESTINTTGSDKNEILRNDYTSASEYPAAVDYISNNINELLKLLGSYADVEEIKQMYTSNGDPPTSLSVTSKHRHKTKKAKTKRTTKAGMHGMKFNGTRDNTVTKIDQNYTNIIFERQVDELATINNSSMSKNNNESYSENVTHPFIPVTESAKIVNTKKKANGTKTKPIQFEDDISKFLGKVQRVTSGYIKKMIKSKSFISDKTKAMNEVEVRHFRTPFTTNKMHDDKTTSKTQPTIVIFNEYDDINDKHIATESYTNPDIFKELLLSIIQHETNKLNDEWLKVEAKRMVQRDTAADMMETLKTNYFFGMTNRITKMTTKKPSKSKAKDNTKTNNVTKLSTSKGKDNTKTNDATKPSTSKKSVSGDLDLNHKSKATTKKPKGFLNKLLDKFGSIATPDGTKENQKAAMKTHPARSIDENKTTKVHKSDTSQKAYTISGLTIRLAQGTKRSNVADVNLAVVNNDTTKKTRKEVCDKHWNPKKLCDVRFTYNHLSNLYKNLNHKNFEKHVRNVTCLKYKEVPKYFIINQPKKRDESVTVVSKLRKWDWIRNKRSLRSHFDNKHHLTNDIHKAETNYAKFHEKHSNSDNSNKYINEDSVNKIRTKKNAIEYDEFDTYDRDKYGIYRLRKKRRKRTVDTKRLDLGLNNLHPLKPAVNEIYAMPGDSVTIDCVTSEYSSNFTTNYNEPSNFENIFWEADTRDILKQDNVFVDGLTVSIENVQPRNIGHYICRNGNRVQRNVRLTVITLPSFFLVLSPTYSSSEDCSYDDLNALQYLGAEVSNVACCDKHCSARVEVPICLKDKRTGQSKMKAAIVIKVDPHPEIHCSVQCRRDLHTSLARLQAANAPILNDIGVVLLNERGNKTFVPSKAVEKPLVTHRLRRKGTKRSQDYEKLISKSTPGDVTIVESCPAGYYLVPEQKICATCPQNTSSAEGDNTCSVCPHGSRAGAGAGRCRLVMSRLRSGGGTLHVGTAWRVAAWCALAARAWRWRCSCT